MTESVHPILSATDVTFEFPQRPAFLKPVRLEIACSQCWGIIGPNGAGKSTLLRLLAGLLKPESGAIRFDGAALADMPPRRRARRIAFLPQQLSGDLHLTAREVVLMGRFPHRRFGLFEETADFQIADRAMAATQTLPFADRPLASLSGGETQRVHIAAALAQQPALLLLDEPTASLDLHHQLGIFTILRRLAAEDRIAVVVVTHDINLAARFCSHILLLDDGRPVASGPPDEVMRSGILESVYAVELAGAAVEGVEGAWWVPLGPRDGASVDK